MGRNSLFGPLDPAPDAGYDDAPARKGFRRVLGRELRGHDELRIRRLDEPLEFIVVQCKIFFKRKKAILDIYISDGYVCSLDRLRNRSAYPVVNGENNFIHQLSGTRSRRIVIRQ